ncbi:MAG: AraC family transcriptional regulator [Gammaproteobacteria bacterium]|nr:AraC family transcriptional regulator [Gammaproteobacteria bacterium]
MDLSWINRILIPNTYVRLLAQEFGDLAQITSGTGIAPDALAGYAQPVTVEQHLRCIRNVLPLRESPDWHLQWGRRMAENFHGAVSLAWLTAPTLGEGLDTFIHYMPSRIPYLEWSGRVQGDFFRCEVKPLIDLGPVSHMLIEVPLIVMHEYVRVMRHGPATAARLELAYPCPLEPAVYARWFDCPVSFDRAGNALLIPLAWRSIANVDFDPGAWKGALARCETQCQRGDDQHLLTRIRRLLIDALELQTPDAQPTLAQVAAQMHVSPRTLIRRLRALDTNFQQLCDNLLKTRARELLDNPVQRVQDIATRLGYTDAASFRKAFRRWFGTTPAEFRDSRHAGNAP